LNVRSASTASTTHPSDLTAKARIRDAALASFGADGFDATSVRSIAEAARVSAALVIHHFGSKYALRDACDAYVLEVMAAGEEQLDDDLLGTMNAWLAQPERFKPVFDYVARTLGEPGDLGARLFHGLVARTEAMIADGVARGEMRASSDPRMQALLVALHGLAPLVLRHHIGRLLGDDALGPAVVQRMTVPTLELYTHGLYTTNAYLDAATATVAPLDTRGST